MKGILPLDCRNVFIIQDRNFLDLNALEINFNLDIILTYDFALYLELKNSNYRVYFIDSLVDENEMQENNFLFYEFFKKWHYDKNNVDIFTFNDISFGLALRLEIWNDLTFYVRTYLCLNKLNSIRYKNVFLGSDLDILQEVLCDLNINFDSVYKGSKPLLATYYFPIYKWLDEKVRYKGFDGLKYKIRDLASLLQSLLVALFDYFFVNVNKRPLVFVQEYHPTKSIVKELYKISNIRVLLATFSRSIGFFRYVPVFALYNNYSNESKAILEQLSHRAFNRMILADGSDITDKLYEIIKNRVSDCLPNYLLNLKSILRYLKNDNLKLVVLVTNLGKTASLIHAVANKKKIPSYLIINGYMSGDFLDDSKYSDFVNAYSESIRNNYYRDMKNNVVVLGDPRMDQYSKHDKKIIDIQNPVITIGASAHSIIDLNSFLAVEFEFLHNILSVLEKLINNGKIVKKILIKTRANGYSDQYYSFVNEYFPNLPIQIVSNISMHEVFIQTDLYITLYSQTHFEAAVYGIPSIYYKNDNEILHPPFDLKSELITARSSEDLEFSIINFMSGSTIFNEFLKQDVLEKYIGPLDGNNLKRNMDYIMKLIKIKDNV
jgi:hypothetical protein